jgi:DeoR/GlpR family transcriptional regulator of sugar metabolism
MLQAEREFEILNILKSRGGFVSVAELCSTLFASESSVRRDLKALSARGLIHRSYGGAVAVGGSGIAAFDLRTHRAEGEKREIAKKAVALISDGDVVFLDQSSTSFYLALELMEKGSLTVVTNNVDIMMLLSRTSVKVISSGGYLSPENRNCLIGRDAERTFDGILADSVFFSVNAVTDTGEVTDCSSEEVAVRAAMLKRAKRKVLLADSSKLGRRAPFIQCHLTELDTLVSNGSAALALEDVAIGVELL